MPFKSKSQMRACFAKHDPDWDCHAWAHETKNRKKLPERIKNGFKEYVENRLAQDITKIANIEGPLTKILENMTWLQQLPSEQKQQAIDIFTRFVGH